MGWCENIEKYILIYLNGLYLIIGLLVTFCGTWLLCDDQSMKKMGLDLMPEFRLVLGIGLIIAGIISIIFYSIGLWGVFKGKKTLLKVYAWILIIAVVMGFIGIFLNHRMPDLEDSKFDTLFKEFGQNEQDTKVVHIIQKTFMCCGYKTPEDSQRSLLLLGQYPGSCCGSENESCFVPTYTQGCLPKIKAIVTELVIGVNVIKIIGIILNIIYIVAAFRLAEKLSKKIDSTPVYHKM